MTLAVRAQPNWLRDPRIWSVSPAALRSCIRREPVRPPVSRLTAMR